jgi:tripartite-type tricarboxylate transporter receptor subunit TctC
VHIPCGDFNPALTDIGAGRIDVAVTGLAQMLPYRQSNQLRFVAIINCVRSPLAPEMQTAAEAGFPDLSFDAITGFFGWRDMNDDLRTRIADDVRAFAARPSIKLCLDAIGIRPHGSTPEEFAAAIEDQRVKIAVIAAAIGAKPSE